jgi:NADPH-dependent 2,4-dienoyl-CoA reductase/sulfur reductase-like enzyme
VFGSVIGRTGLGHAEALKEGLDPLTVELETWDHKLYYPGATQLLLQLTARRDTGKLLGAQIMGAAGAEVSKRLDLLAMALHHGMTVAQLADLDLSYTPPLSSPWDPVQMLGQKWEQERRRQ